MDNHVYGSDLVEHSNRARKDLVYHADRVANYATGAIENGTRRMMFYTFVHMLHENGMSPKNGLFEASHRLTDMAMNNYSSVERPQMYNAAGPIGDVAANLQSFKYNELSRLSLFARQIAEEKSARPLATQLAASIAFAGITGTVGFMEADAIYKMMSKLMGHPDSLNALVIRMSEKVGKAAGATEGGKYALSHGLASGLGLDMSKRLGLGEVVPNGIDEALFPGGSKLVDMAGAAYNLAKSPTEMNAKRAAYEFSPGILQGPEDRAWFSKQTPNGELALNRRTTEGQVLRNDKDKLWKSLGFTGINESIEKQKLWEVEGIRRGYAELRQGPMNTAKDELLTTGRISQATIQKYLKYEGDANTLVADLQRIAQKQNIPAKDLALLRSTMSSSIANAMHAKRLVETYKK
jgi:hypothetical protein